MASSNTDDLKPVASPLDLSLKVVKLAKTIKEEECDSEKYLVDHKSVSSEELLSLKILHDRLTKTMELLLPQEKMTKIEELKSPKTPTPTTEKSVPDFDYLATMKAFLSLVGSENIVSNENEEKHVSSFLPTKVSTAPQVDSWTYWHDYILSMYLMNSSSVPPPPPPSFISPTSLSSSLFPPPLNFFPSSQNSVLFQNMLNSFMSRSSMKTPVENIPKPYLSENHPQDFGYKSKKLNSYQFLKDSNLLYNSFSGSRNLVHTKTKILDSPESFGVSLRGNQKYSIYYQQRPNNIFNNTFLPPISSSTTSSKSTYNSTNKTMNNNQYFTEEHNKKNHIFSENVSKKSLLTNNNNKIHKSFNHLESTALHSKINSEKPNKFTNHDHYNQNNGLGSNGRNSAFDSVPIAIPLVNRYKETVFNCSCGQEFENLYSFTIHMKSTHHSPNSSKIERSIPKLVRGQDMWINSETEQTKEILRCMRCHQSFRTLPELTMHMVETNHYSEIVYSDSGKCVFLNSDQDKMKPSYTSMSSPSSSPGEIIRKLKRTFSSSTGSDIGIEEDNSKKRKLTSPTLSGISSTNPVKEEMSEIDQTQTIGFSSDTEEVIKSEEILQIKEADSGTMDFQPDSDESCLPKSVIDFDAKETNTCDSVIRQIENFVEKSLPKSIHHEHHVASVGLSNSTANSNHRSNKSFSKSTTLKSIDKMLKNDSKKLQNGDLEHSARIKVKTSGAGKSFNFKNYLVSPLEGLENPLSSLQTLVETIQKNTVQIKDQGSNNYKTNQLQNKDPPSYSYSSKSPVVSDSLSQLQALVAGTSGNNSENQSSTQRLKSGESNPSGSILDGKIQSLSTKDFTDSSSTFLTWCNKLGELLGLPQTLSQAMLTQDAIKDLTASVLMMQNKNQSTLERNTITDEDNNNNNNSISELTNHNPKTKGFQKKDCDPIEQLKNLIDSTSDSKQSNKSPLTLNKVSNGSNTHSNNSPQAISKKAKCHFCNKPFANKGQVRLHISKGKCPSTMRSCHSTCNQTESGNSRTISPKSYESSFTLVHNLKESTARISSGICDSEDDSKDNSHVTNKSINMIREYFKFAKQMIGNDDHNETFPGKIESEIEKI